MRSVGPRLLVVLERRRDPLAAIRVRALADDLGLACADALGGLDDPLVDVAERGLGLGDAELFGSHPGVREKRRSGPESFARTLTDEWFASGPSRSSGSPPSCADAAPRRASRSSRRARRRRSTPLAPPAASWRRSSSRSSSTATARWVVGARPRRPARRPGQDRRSRGCREGADRVARAGGARDRLRRRRRRTVSAPAVDRVFVDQGLLAHKRVWVGAGSPSHMAALSAADLVRLARAQPMDAVEAAT